MIHFLTWYLTLTLLGALTFPLVYRLFPKFADRGYSLSRAAGMLIWGYVFWMLTSLGIAQNNIGGLLLGLAVLIALSLCVPAGPDHRPRIPATIRRAEHPFHRQCTPEPGRGGIGR